jgi:hypothetical protein
MTRASTTTITTAMQAVPHAPNPARSRLVHRVARAATAAAAAWRAIATGLLLAAALAGNGVVHAQTDTDTARWLLEHSGTWKQIEGLARGVRGGIVQGLVDSGAKPSSSEVDRLQRATEAAYDAERLRQACLARVAAATSPQHVAALRRWYASGAGQRIARLEEAEATSDLGPDETLERGVPLLEAMPSTRRAALADLVEVTKAAEFGATLFINTVQALQRGLASVLPPDALPPPAPAAALEAQRRQMVEALGRFAIASAAITYADADGPTLSQYVAFLHTDAGRHFNDVVVMALGAAFDEASLDFGRRLPGTRDGANS